MAKRKTPKIAELLRTKDRKEQADRIEALIQAATAPVVTIAIVFDQRSNRIAVVPVDPVSADDLHSILDHAKEYVRQVELEKLKERTYDDSVMSTHPQPVPADYAEVGPDISDL